LGIFGGVGDDSDCVTALLVNCLSHAIQLGLCPLEVDQYNVSALSREEMGNRLADSPSTTHHYGYLAS
jgi:hypothetical protein